MTQEEYQIQVAINEFKLDETPKTAIELATTIRKCADSVEDTKLMEAQNLILGYLADENWTEESLLHSLATIPVCKKLGLRFQEVVLEVIAALDADGVCYGLMEYYCLQKYDNKDWLIRKLSQIKDATEAISWLPMLFNDNNLDFGIDDRFTRDYNWLLLQRAVEHSKVAAIMDMDLF